MDETTGTPEPQSAPPAAPAPAGGPPPSGGRPGPASDTSKLLAAIGYVFWIPAVIALFIEPYKDEKFVKFHAIQALVLGVLVYLIAGMLSAVLIGCLIYPIALIYQIYLAVKAFGGSYVEVPLVYGFIKGYVGE